MGRQRYSPRQALIGVRPKPFHRDPADQLLVATARVLQCPIMTEDGKIAAYPHVRLA